MKKKIFLSVMGEKFEIELEEEFFEFVKDDLIKLQNLAPKELLYMFLNMKKEKFELDKKIEKILQRLEMI